MIPWVPAGFGLGGSRRHWQLQAVCCTRKVRTHMQRFLTSSAIWLASIVLAGGISYAGVSWVLGFQVSGTEFDRFEDVQKRRSAVREVLAIERGGHLQSDDIQRFATAVGVPTETLLSATARHPATLPLEAVIRANPYPQPLPTSNY